MNNSYVRRAGFGAALVGGIAVATTLCATSASATVTNLQVSGSTGGTYSTGTAYTITGSCDGQSTVNFTDNGQSIGSVTPSNGQVSIKWTPQTTGSQTISASGCDSTGENGVPAQTTVTVGQNGGQSGMLGNLGGLLTELGPIIQQVQPLISSLSAQ